MGVGGETFSCSHFFDSMGGGAWPILVRGLNCLLIALTNETFRDK